MDAYDAPIVEKMQLNFVCLGHGLYLFSKSRTT
jgi:hypothetical protein